MPAKFVAVRIHLRHEERQIAAVVARPLDDGGALHAGQRGKLQLRDGHERAIGEFRHLQGGGSTPLTTQSVIATSSARIVHQY